MKKMSYHFLRVGLAITFLWVGVLIFKDPEAWGSYIQPWALSYLPTSIVQAMIATAVLDIAIGILLLLDIFSWVAALVGAVHLFVILITSGITDITVRDIGLLTGTLAICFDAWPPWASCKKREVLEEKNN